MNKRHYEHTLPNIRGSLSNTYQVTFESGYGPSLFEQRGGIDFSLVFRWSPFHDRAEGRLCIIEGVTHVAVQSVAVPMYASALWAYIPQSCCTPLCVLAGGDRRTAVVIGQFQPATVQVLSLIHI